MNVEFVDIVNENNNTIPKYQVGITPESGHPITTNIAANDTTSLTRYAINHYNIVKTPLLFF